MTARRIRVHTASGAMYLIDNENLRWKRTSDKNIAIVGMPFQEDQSNWGTLLYPPTVAVGERMALNISDEQGGEGTYIYTTRVESAEIID